MLTILEVVGQKNQKLEVKIDFEKKRLIIKDWKK